MSFLNKIKSWFVKEEIKPEQIIEQPKIEEVKEQEPKGNCLLCSQPILLDDNTREINGQIFHKRCFKKIKKGMLSGQSMEEIVQKAK